MARVELKELTWLPPEFWAEPAESIWAEVEYLGGDANSTAWEMPLLLHSLLYRRSSDLVGLLLAKGANANVVYREPGRVRTLFVRTPLAEAVARRDVATVRMLLEAGADPLLAEEELNSPPMAKAMFLSGPEGEEIRALLRAVAGQRPFQKKGTSLSCRKAKRGLTGLSAWRAADDEYEWHLVLTDGEFEEAVESCRERVSAITRFEWDIEWQGEKRLLPQPEINHLWAFRLVGNPWTTLVLAERGFDHKFEAQEWSKMVPERRVIQVLGMDGEMYQNGTGQGEKQGSWLTFPEEEFDGLGEAGAPARERAEDAYQVRRVAAFDAWLEEQGCVLPRLRDRSTGFVAKMELYGVARKEVERVALLRAIRLRPEEAGR